MDFKTAVYMYIALCIGPIYFRSVGADESLESVVDDNKILHRAWMSLFLRMFARRSSRLVSTS